jgi:hypothetical protein
MKDAIRESIETYTELLRAHQLNIEILETLELTLYSVKEFCATHNIPFHSSKISSLLSKTDTLLNELWQEPNRRKVTPFRTDEDETEPYSPSYKGGI